jgi:hypothetical protein
MATTTIVLNFDEDASYEIYGFRGSGMSGALVQSGAFSGGSHSVAVSGYDRYRVYAKPDFRVAQTPPLETDAQILFLFAQTDSTE